MNTITTNASATAMAQASPITTPAKDNNTITANDFMTLLVTQMKNQDPTSPTDPSQYMQQLVGVNSLQQLIGINQQLTALTGSTTSTNHPA